MAKKKRKAKRKVNKRSTKKKTSLIFNRWTLQVLIIGLCIIFSYCVVLDYQLRRDFEGKRWSVPARVYAQADELYIGKQISRARLVDKLQKSSYSSVSKISGPGQYRTHIHGIELHSREFDFWDSTEPERRVNIEIQKGRIIRIFDLNSQRDLQIIRLSPILIGKIFPLHDEDRVLIGFNDVPGALIDALIAVEDKNFYNHFGIDPKGILRSIYVNLISGKIQQGGSTITQQLVKNLYLSRERTYTRKINEMIMAIMLDYHYSKESILSAYINEVYLGQNGARAIHGFGTASEFYFSKPLKELKLDQFALLVGLVKGASYYNPRKHPERASKRRNLVLSLMQSEGFISSAEYKSSSSRALNVSKKPGWSSAKYPAFIDLVRRHLKRDYQIEDLRNEGLQIHTTLDVDKQETVQSIIKSELIKLDKQKGFKIGTLQTAFVMVNPHNAEVLCLIGDRDKDKNSFNRALDAKRPIGSMIKPAIYMSALDQPHKFHLLSSLDDSYLELKQDNGKTWIPQNYDKQSHGQVPLIRSIARSYNLSTVRLGMTLGLNRVSKTLYTLGVTSRIPLLPSMLLGSLELSPYETTQLYQTIASGGFRIPLLTIREILDGNSNPLKRYELNVDDSIKPETAYLTQFLLTEVVRNGTAKRLTKDLPSLMPLAGKTGTTNELRDSWFAGFGDHILAISWVGRDDNRSAKLTGSTGAMHLWSSIMKEIKPLPLNLIEPEQIEWRNYPDMSIPENNCHGFRSYPFVSGYVPAQIECF